MIKAFLKKKVSEARRRELRKIQRNFIQDIKALGCGSNLNKLARIYGTDKIDGHFYTQHYMTHLKKFRCKRINLLEIGVGGYDNPYKGGHSLRMWKRYFPFGKIYSMDVYDKSFLQEKRIKIYKGSQVDKDFLDKVVSEIDGLDVIIDDGSHINEHVIQTFNYLFPLLKDGGLYIIEDVQTSYWEFFGGDSRNLNNPKTMMAYFKSLTDSLNHEEFLLRDYLPNYFDKKIISMHFYHNMIFIYKGNNDEKSNLVDGNVNYKGKPYRFEQE